MNGSPYWLQLLQALSTPAVALLAIVIGVMQWRTAHQRAVLDLFQKRWDTYSELRQVLGKVMREGVVPTAVILEYARSIEPAKFLFGPEVNEYLQRSYRVLVDLHQAETMTRAEGPDRDKWIDKAAELLTEMTLFFETLDGLVAPYMGMHQRMPWF
jgi:hypothetical protein